MNASITLLRHATVVIELGGERILVDPMLDPAGARPPIANSPQPRENPLVDLPPQTEEILGGLTAAVVTPLHADHLDDAALRFLAEAGLPVHGQPADLATLRERGLSDVREIEATVGSVRLHRTPGRHGTGELGDRLGPVSGVVLEVGGQRVYVAGDTIRDAAFDETMRRFRPTVAVLNAGGARYVEGDPITMTARDIAEIAAAHPDTTCIAVHMDAINHCVDGRDTLRSELERGGVGNVLVPADGERVALRG